MAKIRADLIGIVTITNTEGGAVLSLRAGDEIPEGVTVGDHVLASGEPEAEPTPDDGGDDDSEDAPADDEIPEDAEFVQPKRTRRRN